MTNIIELTAKETAALIRKDLKEAFPETKFSITSEITGQFDNVTVSHRGGVEPEGIRDYLSKFQSTEYNTMDDYHELKGFEYNGQQYIGADSIHYSQY